MSMSNENENFKIFKEFDLHVTGIWLKTFLPGKKALNPHGFFFE